MWEKILGVKRRYRKRLRRSVLRSGFLREKRNPEGEFRRGNNPQGYTDNTMKDGTWLEPPVRRQ